MASVGIKRSLLDRKVEEDWEGIESDDSDVEEQYDDIESKYIKREQQLYNTHEIPQAQTTTTVVPSVSQKVFGEGDGTCTCRTKRRLRDMGLVMRNYGWRSQHFVPYSS